MDLALNNLKRVDMPLNEETKPNQTNYHDCAYGNAGWGDQDMFE